MNSKSHKRYSSQDLLLIKKLVSENPGNLTKAFNNAALELGRTPKAISLQWYFTLSKTNTAFIIYTKESHTINKKNTSHSTPNNKVKRLFNYISRLIFKL